MTRRKLEPEQDQSSGEPFLQRWSRLKTTAREADRTGAIDDAQPPVSDSAVPADASAQSPDPPVSPDAARLPDLEQLDQDSDYSAFLSPGVDPALRLKALRKLFHSPKFNVCDGLDDYCDDFTRFAPLDSGVVTADMRHHLERAARKLAQASDQPAAGGSSVAGTPVAGEAQDGREDPPAEETPEDDDRGAS
jgi:hypothetical protein